MCIDIGTAGTKAAILDSNGNELARAFEESMLYFPKSGWVEENPDKFYSSSINTIKQTVKESKIDPNDIIAISFTGQMSGILAIDKNWQPVIPYDSWLDTRCKKFIKYIYEENYVDLVLEIVGITPAGSHFPKILWWKSEKPSIFDKIYKFMVPSIYVSGKFADLKGEEAFYDYTYITYTGFYDTRKMDWSEELSNIFDVPLEKFPQIIKPWEIVGELQTEIADKCDLVSGIPIIAGAGDFSSSCFGAGIIKRGQNLDVAGTAAVFALSTSKILPDKKYKTLLYTKAVIPELWIPHASVAGGGLCLRWFRDEIAQVVSDKNSKSMYSLLDNIASVIPQGSENLFFLPHLGGRRDPYNPKMKGLWIGFNWKHKKGHFYRAILESIAYEYYYYRSIMKDIFQDMKFSEVRCVGGGSKSRIWNQIKADVLNVPYIRLNRENIALFGLAAICGYALGLFKVLTDPITKWIKPIETIMPIDAHHEIYKQYVGIYIKLLKMTDKIFNELSTIPDIRSRI